MLKKRLIGTVLVKNGIAVQSIQFKKFLPIGRPEVVVQFLNQWGIDEIILLHIDASTSQNKVTPKLVEQYAKDCQVPLTVGGGIQSTEDVKQIIQAGADKVVINSAAISEPSLIESAAYYFGQQCIVAAIDVKEVQGSYNVFSHGGTKQTQKDLNALIKVYEASGAGEIFINHINNDGMKCGFDLSLATSILEASSIPVIFAGGAGYPKHFAELFNAGVSAAAAGNYFNYTEHSVILAKHYLSRQGLPIRFDSYAKYESFNVPEAGRLTELDEEYLERLRFQFIPEEVI